MNTTPFDSPQNIEVGQNDKGYFINLVHGDDRIHLPMGLSPVTTALVLKANNVRHFDYHISLLTNTTAYDNFLVGADTVGFAT